MIKKKYFFTVLLVICQIVFLSGQSIFTFNQGFADNKNYLINLPYTQTAGKIMIDVVINNQTRKFILDTGAATVISDKLFKELHPKSLRRSTCLMHPVLKTACMWLLCPG